MYARFAVALTFSLLCDLMWIMLQSGGDLMSVVLDTHYITRDRSGETCSVYHPEIGYWLFSVSEEEAIRRAKGTSLEEAKALRGAAIINCPECPGLGIICY